MAPAMPTTMARRMPSPGRTTSPRAWTAPASIEPTGRGFEREIARRLEHWDRLRAERNPEWGAGPAPEDGA